MDFFIISNRKEELTQPRGYQHMGWTQARAAVEKDYIKPSFLASI